MEKWSSLERAAVHSAQPLPIVCVNISCRSTSLSIPKLSGLCMSMIGVRDQVDTLCKSSAVQE